MARLEWQWDTIPFNEDDVVLHKTNILFVDSLTETFGAIGRLANLVISPIDIVAHHKSFAEIIFHCRATWMMMVPTPWLLFTDYLRNTFSAAYLAPLRTLIF